MNETNICRGRNVAVVIITGFPLKKMAKPIVLTVENQENVIFPTISKLL